MNLRMARSRLRIAFAVLLGFGADCMDAHAAPSLAMSPTMADRLAATPADNVVPVSAPAVALAEQPTIIRHRLTDTEPFASVPVAPQLSVSEQRSADIAATITVVAEKNIIPQATPVAMVPTAQQWEVKISDRTLNATFARWSHNAGWQLSWELPADYAVETHAVINGTFEDAVGAVGASLGAADAPIKMIFYAGNKVLRVIAKGRG